MQTLTTVGYGDVVPEGTAGRLIATVVMLNGIAFLTVVTAAVTADARGAGAAEAGPRRFRCAEPDHAITEMLEDIRSRLDSIEASLASPPQDRRG